MALRRMISSGVLAFTLAALSAGSLAKVIVIDVGPPPLRMEVAPAARPGYIRTPGYWGWRDGKHVWIGGTWVRERPGMHWVPHRWEQRDGRWHLHEGHWTR